MRGKLARSRLRKRWLSGASRCCASGYVIIIGTINLLLSRNIKNRLPHGVPPLLRCLTIACELGRRHSSHGGRAVPPFRFLAGTIYPFWVRIDARKTVDAGCRPLALRSCFLVASPVRGRLRAGTSP